MEKRTKAGRENLELGSIKSSKKHGKKTEKGRKECCERVVINTKRNMVFVFCGKKKRRMNVKNGVVRGEKEKMMVGAVAELSRKERERENS